MDIDIVSTGMGTVLQCRGRLVLGDGAAALLETASRTLAHGTNVALDLRHVTQVDAYGAGVLAELADIARRHGRSLVLASVNERVRYMLQVTRLDAVIPGARNAGAWLRCTPWQCRPTHSLSPDPSMRC